MLSGACAHGFTLQNGSWEEPAWGTAMAEFRILGPVTLHVHGRAVDLGPAKIRGLLGILLLSADMAVPIDDIVERLWDGPGGGAPLKGRMPPPNPHKTLQSYVSKLRAALEKGEAPADLHTEHGHYRLEVDRLIVDYHRFRDLADKGTRAARQNDHNLAVSQLSAAVELWHGLPLADINSSWAQRYRENLVHQDLLPAYHKLLDAHLELGNEHHVLTTLTGPLLNRYETDEGLMGLRMRALIRLQGPASVVHSFNAFARKLRDVLGVDPSDGLVQLYRRLIDQAGAHRAARRTPPAAQSRTVVPQLLPRDILNFVGRSEVMRQLDTHLLLETGDQPAVLCLDGDPGVGKTALAIHWAHRRSDHFPDGILYADLNGFGPGSPVPAATVLPRFLDALGIPGESIPTTTSERSALLRQALTGRRLLIMLDNARDSAHVQPLLAATSPCSMLITSRQKLSEPAHQAGAHSITVPTLLPDDATVLLEQRVGVERATGDPQAIYDLLTLCSGLPLAVRIAGDHVAARPDTALRDLVEHLRRRRRLLYAGSHGDGGTKTIKAIFDWSCTALQPDADRMFQLIGMHPSTSISTGAAAAVSGMSIREAEYGLDVLVEAHLIHQQGIDSYRMHDLVHEHAADRAQSNLPPTMHRQASLRLAEWYLLSSMNAILKLEPGQPPVPPLRTATDVVPENFDDQESALGWCIRQRPQMLAVTRRSAEFGLHQHVWRLVGTFANILNRYGDPHEALEVHSLALTSAQKAGSRDGEAGNLNNIGTLNFLLGRYETAASFFGRALMIFREIDDILGEEMALYNLANSYFENGGSVRRVIDLHRKSLTLAKRIDDKLHQARVYHRMGVAYHKIDRPELATRNLVEALKLRRQEGDVRGQGATQQMLGQLCLEGGEVDRAIEFSELALVVAREALDQRSTAAALLTLGQARYRQGRHDLARAHAEEATELCDAVFDSRGSERSLTLLANVEQASGHTLAASLGTQSPSAEPRATTESNKASAPMVSGG